MRITLNSAKEADTMSFNVTENSKVHQAIKEFSDKMGVTDKDGNVTLNAWQLWCSLSTSKTAEHKEVKKRLRRYAGNYRFILCNKNKTP